MDNLFGLPALDARVCKNIRATARRLSRSCTIPGMGVDDIAQDLFLDIWRRRHAFDPTKGSFPTFADRVIANRVATLTSPTMRQRAERALVWLDEPISGDDADTLAATVADPAAPTEHDLAMLLDVRRFVARLSPALRQCCEILLAPKLCDAAAEVGLHRSSVYENIQRLRAVTNAAGLKEYVVAPRHFSGRSGKCHV